MCVTPPFSSDYHRRGPTAAVTDSHGTCFNQKSECDPERQTHILDAVCILLENLPTNGFSLFLICSRGLLGVSLLKYNPII